MRSLHKFVFMLDFELVLVRWGCLEQGEIPFGNSCMSEASFANSVDAKLLAIEIMFLKAFN